MKVMAFPDFSFRDDLPSFPGHEDVLSYLIDYAHHFGLLSFIKVNNCSRYVDLYSAFIVVRHTQGAHSQVWITQFH